MYILDTNVCIELLAGTRTVTEQLVRLGRVRVYTSAITLAELTYGATRSARPAYHVSRARELTKHISVLPVDSRVANEYGFLKSKLASVGQLLEDNDLFIASTAISRNLILVTHDKGFSRIQGLELEDWL